MDDGQYEMLVWLFYRINRSNRRHVVYCHGRSVGGSGTVVVRDVESHRVDAAIAVSVADHIHHIHGLNPGTRIRIWSHAVVEVGCYRVAGAVSPIPGKGQIIAAWIRDMTAGRDDLALVGGVVRQRVNCWGHVKDRHRGADHTDRTVVVLHGQGYHEHPVVTVGVCDRIGYIHGVNVRAGMRVRPHAVIVVGRYRIARIVSPIPCEG